MKRKIRFSVQGTSVEKLNSGLHCIELLQYIDAWDPKASVKKLKDVLAQTGESEAPKRLVVIDSLSSISNAVEDCVSDVMGVIRTAMVRTAGPTSPVSSSIWYPEETLYE